VNEVEGAVPPGLRQAIDVPPFGELADPRVLAGLAAAAEERGWDGFFVWDHIVYRAPVRAVADPWVALAAVACATSRLRIGPLVTPLSRRRVHKLARETVTLDLLSSGRLTLGVGLGSARNGELEPFGEVADPRERALLLDHGLADLSTYWAGASSRSLCSGRGSRSGWRRSGRTRGQCGGRCSGMDCFPPGCQIQPHLPN
jgi:alkanesulfonate monooxygenase SsuD/methylene tetrahydromethanopterin reductase-like flavin-dependent oxidoreductase (luciferase family)